MDDKITIFTSINLYADDLDGQDNWFRPGIKTAELALKVLGSNDTIRRGGGSWQREKPTCWESLYKVCLY